MKVTGRCHCGQISFEAEIDPGHVALWHCVDCQRLTGTAFATFVVARREDFRLVIGTPKLYVKVGDSGNGSAQAFCENCGSRLWASAAVAEPGSYRLRVGTLDQRAELLPARQYWFRSALPWTSDLPCGERVERQ